MQTLRKEQDGFGKRIRELEVENAQQKVRQTGALASHGLSWFVCTLEN